MLKLSHFHGRMFDYYIVCNSHHHRIDLFIDFIQTDQNYYLFRDRNQSSLALSSNFRNDLARLGDVLEKAIIGEMVTFGFLYEYGQLESGTKHFKRSF